jgi:hypothetical protein
MGYDMGNTRFKEARMTGGTRDLLALGGYFLLLPVLMALSFFDIIPLEDEIRRHSELKYVGRKIKYIGDPPAYLRRSAK